MSWPSYDLDFTKTVPHEGVCYGMQPDAHCNRCVEEITKRYALDTQEPAENTAQVAPEMSKNSSRCNAKVRFAPAWAVEEQEFTCIRSVVSGYSNVHDHRDGLGHWTLDGDKSVHWTAEGVTLTVRSPAQSYFGKNLTQYEKALVRSVMATGYGIMFHGRHPKDVPFQGINVSGEEMKKDLREFELDEPGNLRQHKRPTPQADRIMYLVDEWFAEFVKKNSDYQTSSGNVSENFGLMGQYMKLNDKIHKLRKSMWDAEVVKEAMGQGLSNPKPDVTAPFQFEGTEEILRDIIGHCFLALDFIAEENKS